MISEGISGDNLELLFPAVYFHFLLFEYKLYTFHLMQAGSSNSNSDFSLFYFNKLVNYFALHFRKVFYLL